MEGSNVERVRMIFDRFAEGGIEDAMEFLDEDVLVEIPPELSAEPDEYRGHDGVRRYFAGFDGMIEELRYEPIELIAAGDDVVIAHVRLSGRGVSSGVDVDLETFVLHELEGGRVVRMRPYASLEDAQRAAG
jgi:ketosteroid isomerase-like protein